MSPLRFLLGRQLARVIVAIVVGVLSGLLGAGVIAVVSEATSGGERAQPSHFVAAFVALALLSVVTKAISEVLLTKLGQQSIAQLRIELSRALLSAPFAEVQAMGGHRVLAVLQDDAATITQAFVSLPLICVNGATVVGCLAYLGLCSGATLALVLAAMALGAFLFRLHERRARTAFEHARESSDELFRHFRALTSGIKELKLSRARRTAFLTRALGASAHGYERSFVSGMTTYSIATGWGGLLFYLLLGLAVFVLPTELAFARSDAASVVVTLLYLMAPFALLMEVVPSLGRAAVALEKWRTLGLSLAAEPEARMAAGEESAPTRIDLIDVTHRYFREREQGTFVVGPINLTLRSGELLFLVGGNGSGKTTLALLVLGLYRPESGAVLVDGIELDDGMRADYRELFSAVFAEYHVFEQLVELPDETSVERARHYLERLELTHHVLIEAGGLRAVGGLSTGQKKRLALLIALLEDRPFYLFDEWASDQDPQFRRVFYTELLPELRARGKAVLVITHDDQYFELADRCLRMDYGQLRELTARASSRALHAEAP